MRPPDEQSLGQIALESLSAALIEVAMMPAFIGEGGGADGGEKRAARDLVADGGGGEVVGQHPVGEAENDADDRHEREGNELDDGGGYLEFTGELRRERVDGVGADHVEEHEREALGTDDAAAQASAGTMSGNRDRRR